MVDKSGFLIGAVLTIFGGLAMWADVKFNFYELNIVIFVIGIFVIGVGIILMYFSLTSRSD